MLTDKHGIGFRDVLISPQPSDIKSRKEVSLERTFKFKNGKEITCVPIIASNMKSIGTWETAKVLSKYKMLTCLHKDIVWNKFFGEYSLASDLLMYTIPTIGLYRYDVLEQLCPHKSLCLVCLDVANGYTKQFVDFTAEIKKSYSQFAIMAGNVATAEGAERLYEAGADIVKVGLGSGSVCTTRFKTGVGVPQVTAIEECVWGKPDRFGERRGRLVCSDGGCTNAGDVAKAFVAGADFVMLGGLFAGTKETGAIYKGEAYNCTEDYKTSEGKKVIYSVLDDTLEDRVQDILGGLRSTGSYIGQRKIEDFYKAELIQTREQTNDLWGKPE